MSGDVTRDVVSLFVDFLAFFVDEGFEGVFLGEFFLEFSFFLGSSFLEVFVSVLY